MTIVPFRFRLAGALVLLLLPFGLISCATARRRPPNLKMDHGSEGMANSPDVAFLLKAAQSGSGAVQLGTLAREKAGNPAVREVGNQMVSQYGKIEQQLNSLAAARHMTLPETMNATDQGVYLKLQKQSDGSFDKTYLKAMLKDQKSDIKSFTRETKKGRDGQIQNFASSTLPVLHAQLTGFQSLYASTKTSKSAGTR